MSNQARLELLKVREGYVQQLIEKCRACLSTVTKNEEHYTVLLKNLILYGLYQVRTFYWVSGRLPDLLNK